MVYTILITVGAITFSYGHLSYKDLETCLYHKARMEQTILFYKRNASAECKVTVDNNS